MDDAALAEQYARRIAARWGRAHEWRDFWSAAWEGVSRARANGVEGSQLFTAARRAVIDRVKSENKSRSAVRARQFEESPDVLVLDHRSADPDSRLLSAWGEYRRERRGATLRQRVLAYLVLVEGMSHAAAGAALGVTVDRADQIFGEFKSAVRAPVE